MFIFERVDLFLVCFYGGGVGWWLWVMYEKRILLVSNESIYY